MVELALNFWNGEGRFDPAEWGGGLDRHNWQRLTEVLALARGKRMRIFDDPQPMTEQGSQRPEWSSFNWSPFSFLVIAAGVAGTVLVCWALLLSAVTGSNNVYLGPGAQSIAGAVGLAVAVGIFLLDRRDARRAKRLQATLEAQAQLETAAAIMGVNREAETVGVHAPPDIAAVEEPVRSEKAPSPAPPTPTAAAMGIASAVDRFYTQALVLAYGWFVASVLAAIVGLAVIVWELVQASGQPNMQVGLKAASGLLVEAIAALFYRQANATRKHAGDLLASTQDDRRAETARQILGTIQDPDRRAEFAGRLAMRLAGSSPAPRRSAARQSQGPGSDNEPAGRARRRSSAQSQAEEDDQEGSPITKP